MIGWFKSFAARQAWTKAYAAEWENYKAMLAEYAAAKARRDTRAMHAANACVTKSSTALLRMEANRP